MSRRTIAIFISLTTAWLAGCTPKRATAPPAPTPANAAGAPPTASTPAAPAKFTDVSDAAGIRFRHQNSRTPRKYMIETMGAGGGFIDYDADGWDDVVLLNGAPIPGGKVVGTPTMALYHNNRDGTFTDVTRKMGLALPGNYAMGCAVGDYDNDGRDDLYVTCVLGPSHLFHNEMGRGFTDVTARAGVANNGRWGTSCAWLDYDRDGKLDLFVCNYVKYRTLADDQPCYAGLNRKNVYCIPSAFEPDHCALYHNEGGGRFKDVSEASGIASRPAKALGVAVWDFDDDGLPDIFVANDTIAGQLFHNRGAGRFEEIGVESGVAYDDEGTPHSGMGIDADDVMNDGKTILTLTNYQGQQTCLYSLASPQSFRDDRHTSGIGEGTASVLGFGALFLDYDNDGYKDLFQVNGHVQDDIQEREPQVHHAQPSLLFHNQHDGTFQEVGLKSGKPFADAYVGRGCARSDVDHDGRPDVLITSNNGPARLWRNETPTSNHWLTIRLEGVRSNRDGIGALVLVSAGGLRQRTTVRSGSSYLSQSSLTAHFGLGAQTHADLEVRWPSGAVDRIANVTGDRRYTVREGANAARQLP